MTVPRSRLISAEHPACYHLVSRCVRRAWLCGQDPVTGRSFEHRRKWIEDRILFLCERFAVELHSYAVLSNHYHLIVRFDPKACERWTDERVATRWLELYPRQRGAIDEDRRALALAALLEDKRKIALYRARLGSISWMMKLLNESIARRANREDACTGRFWEGRFESHVLLDDPGWLAAMVYVDLNPLRARMSDEPLSAAFTSIHWRLTHASHDAWSQERMPPIAAGDEYLASGAPIGLAAYCELLEWTAKRYYAEDPRESGPPATVHRQGGEPAWLSLLQAMHSRGRRAIGSFDAMKAYAMSIGQRWIRGWSEARRIAGSSAQRVRDSR